MSRRDSSDSSSSDETPATATPLCVICDQAAVGVGPFSRSHLCQKHICVDVADAHKLKEEVAEKLRAYSQGAGAASGVAALGLGEGQSAGSLRLHIRQHLQQVEHRFDQVQRDLDSFRRRVTGQLESLVEALSVCERDLEDVSSYKQEVATAEASGDMSELVKLAESMQASLGDLEADFKRAARLQRDSIDSEELQLRLLGQLERLVGNCAGGANGSKDDVVVATPQVRDAAASNSLFDPIVFSHEVKLDDKVMWLAVCSDTRGFVGDRSGRVVHASSAGDGSEALPQPCIFADIANRNYLTVLSVDGSVRLQCDCNINSTQIRGLLCCHQLLFIAQFDMVTVTDLSGCSLNQIYSSQVNGFGEIRGIASDAASVFVSSGNKIAAFNKTTGQNETVITLSQLPDADLRDMVMHNHCALATDRKNSKVHRIDGFQSVASYPTQLAGDCKEFSLPMGLAVDRRGRLFVSEYQGHSVRAVAADDGSLLWTLGVPGESGSGEDRLNFPWGLAVVNTDCREQLVVADRGNMRLLVLNIE